MTLRKRHILNIFLGAALLMSGGCIMDDYVDAPAGDGLGAVEVDTIGYMSLRLQTYDDLLTRAGVGDEFEAGTGLDYALAPDANHIAVFFKKGINTPTAVADISGANSQELSSDMKANSSIAFAAIIGRSEILEDLQERLNQLEECLVLLNTDLKAEQMWGMSRDKLLGMKVESPFFRSKDGKDYLTMSNTIYLDGSAKKTGCKVDPYQIYSSYMEAIEQAWKGNAAVEAYVEHASAKFKLSFEDPALNEADAVREFVPAYNPTITVFSHINRDGIPFYDNGPAAAPYKCKVRLTGWGINATEQQTYLFRNISEYGNYFQGWNNPALKRSYWSVDPNYYSAKYPWQYRRVIDNSGLTVYQNGNNILRNYSYDELNANKFTSKYLYAPENTYDFTDAAFAKALDNRPELLAGTHVIVCGELLTNLGDPNVYKTEDLFRDRNGNFYRDGRDCFRASVAIMNNTLKAHSFLKFTYWDWTNGGIELKLFGNTKGDYSLYWNNTKITNENADYIYDQLGGKVFADAEFKGGDGKRVLWFDGLTIKDASGKVMDTYSNIDEVNHDNDVRLRSATNDDLKSVIFEHVGAFEHYSGGRMYYSIPVGYVQNGVNADGSQKYSVHGVVRNSLYDICIKGVNKIGAAVDVPGQPIVPGGTDTQDHLFIGFDILDWHLVEQKVPGAIQ